MSQPEIRVTVDSAQAQWAFARAPNAMARYVRLGTEKGADVVTRAARQNTSESGGFGDVFGNLRKSIITAAMADLPDGIVGFESRADVRHAVYVEEGTGPAAGHAKYFPDPDALLAVLRQSPRSRGYKWAKKGSKKRGGQDVELRRRSRAWAMSIYARGTKAHPFMAPAADRSDAAVRAVMSDWVGRGIAEVFGAGR
jgi:hypothetical protein